MIHLSEMLGYYSPVFAQARLPCLGAQALTRVLHTMISAVCTISPSSSTTLHSTGKGWPSTLAWPFVDPVQDTHCALMLYYQTCKLPWQIVNCALELYEHHILVDRI